MEFSTATRIVYGVGSFQRLGELASQIGAARALIVSDPGIVEAGYAARAGESLEAAGIAAHVFDGFGENPTSEMGARGAEVARKECADLLIGLGGGSSLDCAKAINFLFTNGGHMAEYRGYGKATRPMLPMIAVPTTAGTGSEVQSYALITNDDNSKIACGDQKAAFRIAILDPVLTVSQPAFVTAATGYDAIGHAVESYVTLKRSPASQMFALEAWRLLEKNFDVVLREPENISARGAMLLGSCYAGIAIENSMLGATHALANPLSQLYDTTHGVAIAMLLHHVVRWNRSAVDELYDSLAEVAGCNGSSLEQRLYILLESSSLPTRLRDAGVQKNDIPVLARMAMEQWTGTFNPRPLTEADAVMLYEAAF